MRLIKSIGECWTRVSSLVIPPRDAEHPVPRETASWFYVFGSAAFVVFVLQVVTASCWRSFTCLPPVKPGTVSRLSITTSRWLVHPGPAWLGSNFMIAIVLIHMIQVFLFGAYKYPRELTWIVVCSLARDAWHGLHGTGFEIDQDAYWGLGIGASIASRVPLIGLRSST